MNAFSESQFFSIAGEWRLSWHQQTVLLGEFSISTLFWLCLAPGMVDISLDTLERARCIKAIHDLLRSRYAGAHPANLWIASSRISLVFGGSTVLDLMLSGSMENLYWTRHYLELNETVYPIPMRGAAIPVTEAELNGR